MHIKGTLQNFNFVRLFLNDLLSTKYTSYSIILQIQKQCHLSVEILLSSSTLAHRYTHWPFKFIINRISVGTYGRYFCCCEGWTQHQLPQNCCYSPVSTDERIFCWLQLRPHHPARLLLGWNICLDEFYIHRAVSFENLFFSKLRECLWWIL